MLPPSLVLYPRCPRESACYPPRRASSIFTLPGTGKVRAGPTWASSHQRFSGPAWCTRQSTTCRTSLGYGEPSPLPSQSFECQPPRQCLEAVHVRPPDNPARGPRPPQFVEQQLALPHKPTYVLLRPDPPRRPQARPAHVSARLAPLVRVRVGRRVREEGRGRTAVGRTGGAGQEVEKLAGPLNRGQRRAGELRQRTSERKGTPDPGPLRTQPILPDSTEGYERIEPQSKHLER